MVVVGNTGPRSLAASSTLGSPAPVIIGRLLCPASCIPQIDLRIAVSLMIQPIARAHSLGPDFPPILALSGGLSAKVVCGKLPCSIFSLWPLRGVRGKERQGLLMVEARALLLNGVRVLLFMFPLSTSASGHAPHGRSNTRQSNETLKPKTPIGLSISIPILLGLESNGY